MPLSLIKIIKMGQYIPHFGDFNLHNFYRNYSRHDMNGIKLFKSITNLNFISVTNDTLTHIDLHKF